jgi:hypothetical protein
MPSLLTHQYFATKVMDVLKKDFPYLYDFYSVVTLGAQGPDPLFFYGMVPWRVRRNKNQIQSFGSALHNLNPNQTLLKLMETVDAHSSPMWLSYVIGAISHYALDATVHPYVFFHTGFDTFGQLVPPFQSKHALFEVLLDVAVLQKYQLDRHHYHPAVTLGVSDEQLAFISQQYGLTYAKEMTPLSYRDAVKDMQRIYQFLFQAKPLKKFLVKKIFGQHSMPYNLMHPKEITSIMERRLLNESHQPYKHPVSGLKLSDDMDQMIEIALKLFLQLVKLLDLRLKNEKIPLESFDDLTKLIDYDGKQIHSNMKFFTPFFKNVY